MVQEPCTPVTRFPAQLANGSYCMTFDVGVAGMTPLRLASDVTLDCRGHRIYALPGYTPQAVYAEGDNIVLKNCVIEGFRIGIAFENVTRYRIESNTLIGSGAWSINASGKWGQIYGNVITNPRSLPSHYWGINASGSADIVGNSVMGAEGTGYDYIARYGVISRNNPLGILSRNFIRNIHPAGGGQGWGIGVMNGVSVVVADNVVTAPPGKGDLAFFCYMVDPISIGNVVTGYSQRFTC